MEVKVENENKKILYEIGYEVERVIKDDIWVVVNGDFNARMGEMVGDRANSTMQRV